MSKYDAGSDVMFASILAKHTLTSCHDLFKQVSARGVQLQTSGKLWNLLVKVSDCDRCIFLLTFFLDFEYFCTRGPV